jgi:hypothetical protein
MTQIKRILLALAMTTAAQGAFAVDPGLGVGGAARV